MNVDQALTATLISRIGPASFAIASLVDWTASFQLKVIEGFRGLAVCGILSGSLDDVHIEAKHGNCGYIYV